MFDDRHHQCFFRSNIFSVLWQSPQSSGELRVESAAENLKNLKNRVLNYHGHLKFQVDGVGVT